MILQRLPISFLFFTITLFSFVITSGYAPQALIASPRLPNVPPEMERPQFWIKKIKNPALLLLTPEMIHQMNEDNLKRQDIHLCRINDLKEDWSMEEILSLIKEDWEKLLIKDTYFNAKKCLECEIINEIK